MKDQKHDDHARGHKWGSAQADLPRRSEGFSEQHPPWIRQLIAMWRERARSVPAEGDDAITATALYRCADELAHWDGAPLADATLGPDRICEECGHIFTAVQIEAEDPTAWGHPCYGTARKGRVVCESHRPVVAVDAPPPQAQSDVAKAMFALVDELKSRGVPFAEWAESTKLAFSDAIIDHRPLTAEDIARSHELFNPDGTFKRHAPPPQAEEPWQPIATAPRNGILVLLTGQNGVVLTGFFKEGRWQTEYVFHTIYDPTRWMPMPNAPRPTRQEGSTQGDGHD